MPALVGYQAGAPMIPLTRPVLESEPIKTLRYLAARSGIDPTGLSREELVEALLKVADQSRTLEVSA